MTTPYVLDEFSKKEFFDLSRSPTLRASRALGKKMSKAGVKGTLKTAGLGAATILLPGGALIPMGMAARQRWLARRAGKEEPEQPPKLESLLTRTPLLLRS